MDLASSIWCGINSLWKYTCAIKAPMINPPALARNGKELIQAEKEIKAHKEGTLHPKVVRNDIIQRATISSSHRAILPHC